LRAVEPRRIESRFVVVNTALTVSFQDNLVKPVPVPERQTILGFGAVEEDGNDNGDIRNFETCRSGTAMSVPLAYQYPVLVRRFTERMLSLSLSPRTTVPKHRKRCRRGI